ncbi:uncharacterized protein RBU33_011340 [Hipposideros larvatus]
MPTVLQSSTHSQTPKSDPLYVSKAPQVIIPLPEPKALETASKGLQGLKHQVEGATQDAATAAGAAVQQVLDQATEAGQKAMDQVAKSMQETINKTANQASETFLVLGEKLGLLK